MKIEGSSSSPPHPKPTPSHASQNHGNPKASSAQNHPSQSSKAAPSKSAAHAENAKPPSAPTASSSSTNGAKPATSSKATNHSPSHDSGHSSSAHQSSASPPKPSQSAAGSQGKDNGQGGKKEDDDNFNLNSGAFRPVSGMGFNSKIWNVAVLTTRLALVKGATKMVILALIRTTTQTTTRPSHKTTMEGRTDRPDSITGAMVIPLAYLLPHDGVIKRSTCRLPKSKLENYPNAYNPVIQDIILMAKRSISALKLIYWLMHLNTLL